MNLIVSNTTRNATCNITKHSKGSSRAVWIQTVTTDGRRVLNEKVFTMKDIGAYVRRHPSTNNFEICRRFACGCVDATVISREELYFGLVLNA